MKLFSNLFLHKPLFIPSQFPELLWLNSSPAHEYKFLIEVMLADAKAYLGIFPSEQVLLDGIVTDMKLNNPWFKNKLQKIWVIFILLTESMQRTQCDAPESSKIDSDGKKMAFTPAKSRNTNCQFSIRP